MTAGVNWLFYFKTNMLQKVVQYEQSIDFCLDPNLECLSMYNYKAIKTMK